ncbi:hypothetical protein YC2023_011913 [Brassica napus]
MASTPLNTSGHQFSIVKNHGNDPSARTFTPRPISPLLIAHTWEEMDDLASSRSTRVEVIKCLRNRSEVLDHIPTYQAQSYHRGTLNTPEFHSIRSVCFEVGGTSGTAPRSGTIHHSLSFRGWMNPNNDDARVSKPLEIKDEVGDRWYPLRDHSSPPRIKISRDLHMKKTSFFFDYSSSLAGCLGL